MSGWRFSRFYSLIESRISRDDLLHGDFPDVFPGMLEPNTQDGPSGAKAHAIRPFDEDNRRLVEQVFEAKRVEIVGIGDAIQIDVKDSHVSVERMDESERGAGDVLFTRRAQAADDPFGERRLARAQFAGEQNQERRLD